MDRPRSVIVYCVRPACAFLHRVATETLREPPTNYMCNKCSTPFAYWATTKPTGMISGAAPPPPPPENEVECVRIASMNCLAFSYNPKRQTIGLCF